MIEFDYRQERLRTGEVIFRPVAKVYLLRAGSEWIAEYFYVDSGADYTLIPYRMGRFLGLDRIASEVKEIGGNRWRYWCKIRSRSYEDRRASV
ncbi:MAG TPA: hypothetical protein ACFYD6_10310 [Candidatus Brocadiia bacterium]|nr:hypothetical protein [Planctomycetota bacterium]MBI4008580.1 hypothetical protein [Planctomycetota bacterium]MDO8093579.1 hypothetical protein [Candidatus Brocadiales bacterium]